MKKMMFNDRYGLTKAVLNGTKTQTRRVVEVDDYDRSCLLSGDKEVRKIRTMSVLTECKQHRKGDVVAVAQSYGTLLSSPTLTDKQKKKLMSLAGTPGYRNKMFVGAENMQHHIQITDVRLERLQNISDEDCLKEGIYEFEHRTPDGGVGTVYGFDHGGVYGKTPKEAYSLLIDKITGKGTWSGNPFVIVYEFRLFN